MTVQTPFPDRPATPNWSTRGEFASGRWGSGLPEDLGLAGLGDEQTTARVLNAITAGSVAAERSLMWPGGYGSCPMGTVPNPSSGMCEPGGTVSASASPGALVVLVGVGALLFFMSRGGR